MNRGFFSLSSLVGLAICLPLSGWSITLEPTGPDSGPTAAASTDETTPAPVLAETDSAATGVNAPATVVSTEVAVPSNLHLNSASTELVKLANSGVDQSVMLSYVTNSTSTFDLGADEIVYLRDIGVAGDVITAMIQHDQELRVQPGTQAVPPPAPEQPAPAPPAPSQPEPQSPAPVEAPLTPPADAPAYSSFYNVLAPYGTWVNVDGYGLCWQPTVVVANPGWSPYWNCGHWVYSDLGWYWYSDYSWGWAPFHYGRWFCHARLGWCWEPDRVWGPAWVSWRCNDSFCGWAPLGPGVFFSASVGFTFGPHCWRDWDRPSFHHFVAWGDFHDHDLYRHGLDRGEVTRVYNHTVVQNRVSVYNHVTINEGIPRDRVVAATHTDVRPVALHEVRDARFAGSRLEQLDPARHRLTVYRPTLAESGSTPRANHASARNALPSRTVPAAVAAHPYAPSALASAANVSQSRSLRFIGRRGATPVQPTDHSSRVGPRSEPASVTTRVPNTQPAVPQAPSHTPLTARLATVPQSPPHALSSPAPATRQLPPNIARTPGRFETPNPARPFATPSAPAVAQSYNRPQNSAPVFRSAPSPAYRPPAHSAPVAPAYTAAPRQYSALSFNPRQTPAAAAPRYNQPRYDQPAHQYSGYQAAARPTVEAPRYNSIPAPRYTAPSYVPPRSYAPAPQPRYNSAPAYMPQRSYSPPQYHSAPAPAPHFSAPPSPSFSRGSGFGPGSNSSSHGSDHGSGGR